jgi:hypothetical protein
MPDKTRREKVNPQITEAEIGVRILRKIKIYPLSMADQLTITDVISEAMQAFFTMQDAGKEDISPEFIAFAVQLLKDNIDRIIEMVTGEDPEKVKKDLTNDQLSDIVTIVYTNNFEGPLKKVQSLFQRDEILEEVTDKQILSSLQPRSAKSTDIDSTTSTKNHLKKVD